MEHNGRIGDWRQAGIYRAVARLRQLPVSGLVQIQGVALKEPKIR